MNVTIITDGRPIGIGSYYIDNAGRETRRGETQVTLRVNDPKAVRITAGRKSQGGDTLLILDRAGVEVLSSGTVA
jgi:hypothetical protein